MITSTLSFEMYPSKSTDCASIIAIAMVVIIVIVVVWWMTRNENNQTSQVQQPQQPQVGQGAQQPQVAQGVQNAPSAVGAQPPASFVEMVNNISAGAQPVLSRPLMVKPSAEQRLARLRDSMMLPALPQSLGANAVDLNDLNNPIARPVRPCVKKLRSRVESLGDMFRGDLPIQPVITETRSVHAPDLIPTYTC